MEVHVLLNSFHLNGHTVGFHPQTQMLGSPLVNNSITDSGSEKVEKGNGMHCTHCRH